MKCNYYILYKLSLNLTLSRYRLAFQPLSLGENKKKKKKWPIYRYTSRTLTISELNI